MFASTFRELDAFIFDEPFLLFVASQQQEDCRLRLVGPTFLHSGFGLAFPKHSPWTRRFSGTLLFYESTGAMQKLINHWLIGKCTKQKSAPVSKFAPMDVGYTTGAIAIFTIGIGVALVTLLVEFRVHRHGGTFAHICQRFTGWQTRGSSLSKSSATSACKSKKNYPRARSLTL